MNVDMTIGLPPDEDSPTGASSVYGSLPPRVLGYGAPGLDREKAQRAAMVRSLREPGPGVRLMSADCARSCFVSDVEAGRERKGVGLT